MIFLMKKSRIRGMIYQKVISVTITDVFLFQGGRIMKKLAMTEALRKKLTKAGALALAAVVAMGGGVTYYNSQNQVPELITYVDTDGSIEIPDEDVPLAAPKAWQKSTKTKKKVKKIKMKKASKKTYKKAGKTVTKKKKKVKSSKKNVTTTETLTATNVTNAYKKGSKIDTRVTTVKTTVIKTVAPTGTAAATAAATGTATTTATKATTAGTASAAQNGEIAITQIAPLVSGNVTSAFQKLGFKIVINSGVSYSGLCDARTRTVTLKRADNTVYHELGHFVAFAGNIDTSPLHSRAFTTVRNPCTQTTNKAYVLSIV